MANRNRGHLRRTLIFILVMVLIGVAVRLMFPGERVGRLVATAIRERTGGTAVFGDVTIGLRPDLRVILSDGVIAGTGEQLSARLAAETDIVKYMMRFGSLEISVSWRELLSRRLQINRITLREPNVELVTQAPSPPAAATAAKTGAASAVANVPGESGAGMAMVLAGFEVRDGVVKFFQIGTGLDLVIEGWQQEVSPGDLGLIAQRLEAFQAQRPSYDRVLEDARLRVSTRLGRVSVASAELPTHTFEDIRLQGDVILPNAADHIGIELQQVAWSGLSLAGAAKLEPTSTGYLLAGSATLVGLQINSLVAGLVGALPEAERAPLAWTLEQDFTLDSSRATGEFRIPLPRPVPDDLQDVLSALVAEIDLRNLGFQPPGLPSPLSISANAQMSRATARITDLTVREGGGLLAGTLLWRDFPAESSRIDLDLVCEYLPVSLLDRYLVYGCTDFINGEASGSFDGTLRIEAKQPDWRSLQMDGRMALRDGVIHASAMLDDISKYLGNRQDLKEIRFNELEHDMRIDAGRYHIENLRLGGPDTDWRGEGSFDPAGTIDMKLGVKFPKDFQPDLGGFAMLAEGLRDQDGRLTLDLVLSGQAARPDVMLDLSNNRKSAEDGAKRVIKGFLDKLKRK